jgi:uncharacterized integral membrane protein
MDHTNLLRIARRRAAAKFGFLIHLTVFIAVNGVLYAINQRTTPDVAWSLFPLGGWALGLAIHGLVVFASASGFRERMVAEELARLERAHAAAGVGSRRRSADDHAAVS